MVLAGFRPGHAVKREPERPVRLRRQRSRGLLWMSAVAMSPITTKPAAMYPPIVIPCVIASWAASTTKVVSGRSAKERSLPPHCR